MIISIGQIMYTDYAILLLIASLLLILSMIGCIVITFKTRDSFYTTIFIPLSLGLIPRIPFLTKNRISRAIDEVVFTTGTTQNRILQIGGPFALGPLGSNDQPASAEEAARHVVDANKEASVSKTISAEFAAQGKPAQAAEAAQDAQEWSEKAQEAKAAFIYYINNR